MADFVGSDRLGNRVCLTDHTWYRHIARRHPEMAVLRAEVEAACMSADEIRQSQSDPECVIHYRACLRRPGLLIMVVANVADGFVRTAHLAKTATGGARLWPPPHSTA